MAHFAKLDVNNKVIEVHTISNDVLDPQNEEQSGIDFLISWSGGYTKWKQTSYNGTFRKNYAGVGYFYDEDRDAFIAPKIFDSWTLDEVTCRWQPPKPYPQDGIAYSWDENVGDWI